MDYKRNWWKITLAVWGPLLVLAATYGVIYIIATKTANNALAECVSRTTVTQKEINDAAAHDQGAPAQFNCSVEMGHDKIGLPTFAN